MMGSLRDAPAAALVGATLATIAGTFFVYRKKKRREELRRPRSWSFTSTGMALGSFPPRVDCPEHTINASIMFQDCPHPQDIVKHIIPKMLQYERLATVPEPEDGTSRHPVSVDPSKFVRHIVVNGDKQCTLDAIQDHLFDSLVDDREDLPWWEILIIDNQGPGVSACVLRFHHCLGDGISFLKIVEDIFTNVDGSPLDAILPPGIHKKFRLKLPFLKLVWSSIVAAFQVLLLPISAFDDDTLFSCGNKDMIHTRNRSFVMLRPMPLDFVKELKNAANVPINDVLYACLSQTIHDYLVEQECPVFKARGNKLQCRALVPVGIPQPLDKMHDKSLTLRNKWVLVSADMDVGESDVNNRLEYVHTRLNEIKNSPLALVQMRMQDSLIPLLPVAVSRKTVFDSFSRHSLVFTNVPGPAQPVHFAGKEVSEMQVFYGNLVSQVSFMSYRGTIFGNFCLDNEAIPNSQSLARLYVNSFVELAKRFNVTVPSSVLND